MSRAAENSSPETRADHPGFFSRIFADRDATLRTLTSIVSLLLVVVVIAIIVVGYFPLKLRTSQVKAAPVSVVFYWPPVAGNPPQGVASSTWVNAEIRRELEKLTLGLLSSDPLDTASLGAAREALIATGWFNPDLRLTRDGNNAVHVRGTWKTPIAAVRGVDGKVDQLVSAKGELLPPRYKPDASGMKVIVGVRNDPPKLGDPWIGGDVQAGLQLLEYLAALPAFNQVAAVDVSEYSPGRKLTIITDLGNRILWGGAPDEFNPGQAAPQTKLGRLAQMYREHGRIDANRAMLDIRLITGVYIVDANALTTEPAKPETTRTASRSNGTRRTAAPASIPAQQPAHGNTHRR